MKKSILFFILTVTAASAQNFIHPLAIPPLLSGSHIQLDCAPSSHPIYPGQATSTYAINGEILGPTLLLNSGDSVHVQINNQLPEETSLHWHGLHVPAEVDGGPETTIPAGSTFTADFEVKNQAATYWYHPHVHMKTQEQVNKGMGGLIIVKDTVEGALALPRTYGTDDFPIILQDRSYTSANQFVVKPLGDSMLVNGVARPYLEVPAQMVRLRILNGSNGRVYNLGFSDNRNFYVIGSDGGLLAAPFLTNRIKLANGERIEIVVSFDMQTGRAYQLKSYASSLPTTVPGNLNAMLSGNGPLERTDFDILEFRVTPALPGAILTVPASLTTITTWDTLAVNRMRYRTLTGQGSLDMGNFYIDGNQYISGHVNDTMRLGDIERWNVTNLTNISHPMHIHGLSFRILSRNGATPPASESGWKDVFHILPQETVSLIMRFEDYTTVSAPYMYHCHLLAHEDMGMMTSFIVVDTLNSSMVETAFPSKAAVYPNPSTGMWKLLLPEENELAVHVVVMDNTGRPVFSEDVTYPYAVNTAALSTGIYHLQITSSSGKSYRTTATVQKQ